MSTQKRRARPATEWQAVRKDLVDTGAIAEAGKAPPAQAAAREYPGERVKVPPVHDVDRVEEVALPRVRKDGCAHVDINKCGCDTVPIGGQPQAKEETAAPTETASETNPPEQPSEAEQVMLALWTPTDLGKKLAQPGGEHPDDMHVTLGYYGRKGEDVSHEHVETMYKCAAKAATGYSPVKAAIGGVGRFNGTATSDNKDVLIAHVDSPGLHDLRDHLMEQVRKCASVIKDGEEQPNSEGGPSPRKDHGYTPHITLAYIDPDGPMPVHKLPREEFTFTHLVMAVGKKRVMYALGEQEDVARKMWCPIIKAVEEQRLVTGIVLQPEVVDAQGDIIAADVIAKTAHNFLALYNKKTQLGLQHEMFGPEGIDLVESWLAPVDMVVNGRDIIAGTWMMTVRVNNDAVWSKVKAGGFTGFSIGGVAKVRRLAS